MGTIFNIQRYCLHDGDGIRTNVFFKGCPLRCIWCHNPEGLSQKREISYNAEKCTLCNRCIDDCPGRSIEDGHFELDRSKCSLCGKCIENCPNSANELIGREVSADEVMAEVVRDKIYYKTSGGGMTLSGGEPSMQAEFALELVSKAKDQGIGVAIETCGIGSREFYEKCSEEGVTFLFDIKCIDSNKHKELTGVADGKILDNLRYLFSVDADVIIRLPMIPGINDTDEDIKSLCDFLLENAGKYRYAELMPYHSFGASKAKKVGAKSPFVCADATDTQKEIWRKRFEKNGINVKISR